MSPCPPPPCRLVSRSQAATSPATHLRASAFPPFFESPFFLSSRARFVSLRLPDGAESEKLLDRSVASLCGPESLLRASSLAFAIDGPPPSHRVRLLRSPLCCFSYEVSILQGAS